MQQQPSYPVINPQTYMSPQDDYLNVMKPMNNRSSPMTGNSPLMPRANQAIGQSPPMQQQSDASLNAEMLKQLSMGFNKMMTMLERLEQRVQRVEQSTAQILKNQQETFQVPFMSQSDIDSARQAAELLERDSSVAKQLQAAYNKEVEVRKSLSSTSQTKVECPLCGARVSGVDIEVHVDQCLEMFSNDPKKETQVQDAKKKMDQGFFSRFIKSTPSKKTLEKTETTTTKVVTTTSTGKSEASAPLLGDPNNVGFYPTPMPYPFPPAFASPNGQQSPQPMMMPMYMYPSYPPAQMPNDNL